MCTRLANNTSKTYCVYANTHDQPHPLPSQGHLTILIGEVFFNVKCFGCRHFEKDPWNSGASQTNNSWYCSLLTPDNISPPGYVSKPGSLQFSMQNASSFHHCHDGYIRCMTQSQSRPCEALQNPLILSACDQEKTSFLWVNNEGRPNPRIELQRHLASIGEEQAGNYNQSQELLGPGVKSRSCGGSRKMVKRLPFFIWFCFG